MTAPPPAVASPRAALAPAVGDVPTAGSSTHADWYAEYPAEAYELGLQGTTKVLVDVTEHGMAGAVSVAVSSGHDILDQAALKAVRRWPFKPGMRDGVPVPRQTIVYVRYRR